MSYRTLPRWSRPVALIVASSWLTVPDAYAQIVPVPPDTIRITHDSTGHGQVHPHDIPDEKGLFIYSANGQEALRIFGSFRMLAVLDNKKNFHAYDLTQPTIPTGADDFRFPNSTWTATMSRIGLDALIAKRHLGDLLIRMEFDWKGDNEKFRIRHLFLRSRHWLIGKSWSTTSSIAYLIQGIDGRFAGGAVGSRPPQVRYYNQNNNWTYQFSLEYLKPKLIQPDALGAEGTTVIPSLAARVSHDIGLFRWMVAGVLRRNRVQFTSGDRDSQALTGYGIVLAAAVPLGVRNRFKMGVNGGSGTAGFLGDFAFVDMDLAYNPATGNFENVGVFSGFLGFEHDWSTEFTSAIGGGIANSEAKSFFPAGFYHRGSKVLINLFFRPAAEWNNIVVGLEVEYADRRNLGTPSNNATRASVLLFYNF